MENITASEVFNFVNGSNMTRESSFDVWKSLNPDGTAVQFIEHLRGDSSYEVWLNQEGNEGKTVEEYIQAMKVASSNYDFWLSLGYEGTPEDYLNFIKGKSAYEVWLEKEGNEGKSEEEFLASLGGANLEELTSEVTQIKSDLEELDNRVSSKMIAYFNGDINDYVYADSDCTIKLTKDELITAFEKGLILQLVNDNGEVKQYTVMNIYYNADTPYSTVAILYNNVFYLNSAEFVLEEET